MVLQHKKLAWGSTILLLVLNLILVTKLWQEILPQALQGDRKALAAIGALIFLVALFTLLNYLLTRWALARGSSIVKRYVEQVALRKSKM
ncbi:MAG: hypothetical protein HWD59_01000 [Coxiellaceae bacterium]|nr:MAG: hypothetical protein HWD59_01000 [Coxiellaceae bacterium]